jgi:hypothetical protein
MATSVAKTCWWLLQKKICILALATWKMAKSVAKTCWWLLQKKIMYSSNCHLEDGNISGQNMLAVATKENYVF